MPVYNTKEEYLKKSIETVLSQTFEDFELIIINDGSKTDVKSVVDIYDDKRIKYLVQKNKGLSGARNTGMDNSRGDYILFLDSDDYLPNNSLEKLFSKASRDDLDVLFFGVVGYDDTTKEKSAYDILESFPKSLENTVFDYNHESVFNNIFLINQTSWSKLFKKDFLIKNELEFSEGIIFEDTEFFFRFLFQANRMSFIRDFCYVYRQNVEGSIVENGDKRYFDVFGVIDSVENELVKKGLFEKLKIQFYEFKFNVLRYRYKTIRQEYKNEFKARVIKEVKNYKLSKKEFKKLSAAARLKYYYFTSKIYWLRSFLNSFKTGLYSRKLSGEQEIIKICFLKFKRQRSDYPSAVWKNFS